VYVAGLRVPEPVCTDDIASYGDISFGEIQGYRLVETATALRAGDWPIRLVPP
jgi:hypothetical protein